MIRMIAHSPGRSWREDPATVAPTVLIVGGFLTSPPFYWRLRDGLLERGAPGVVIAPVWTPDWLLSAVRGFGPIVTRAGRALLQAGEVSRASDGSRGAPVLLVGHSAGGMIARLLTSPEPFAGRRLGAPGGADIDAELTAHRPRVGRGAIRIDVDRMDPLERKHSSKSRTAGASRRHRGPARRVLEGTSCASRSRALPTSCTSPAPRTAGASPSPVIVPAPPRSVSQPFSAGATPATAISWTTTSTTRSRASLPGRASMFGCSITPFNRDVAPRFAAEVMPAFR